MSEIHFTRQRGNNGSETLPLDLFLEFHITYRTHPHTCCDIGIDKQKRG
jgi:hypothetical protein